MAARNWTPEQRQRQAGVIKRWSPCEQSTGPRLIVLQRRVRLYVVGKEVCQDKIFLLVRKPPRLAQNLLRLALELGLRQRPTVEELL